jgi:hypothetical protein
MASAGAAGAVELACCGCAQNDIDLTRYDAPGVQSARATVRM